MMTGMSNFSFPARSNQLPTPLRSSVKTVHLSRFGMADSKPRMAPVALTARARLAVALHEFLASTVPDATIARIEDLTPHRLRELGDVRGIIFDLDDTLMPLLSGKFPPAIIQCLHHLQKAGFKMGIVTNNIQPEYCRNARIKLREAGLHIPFIEDAQKPNPKGFSTMRDYLGLDSCQVAVVGDGFLSDIRCANLLEMKSVQATWFARSAGGQAVSYLQDMVTTSFNCLRNLLSDQPHLTLIESKL
jgi:HAD superfamily phosphatase (TIGR01668 family)